MRLSIARHKRVVRFIPRAAPFFGVGDEISRREWASDHVPREGELVTCEEFDGAKWTGRVTGVQTVFPLDAPPLACITVVDDSVMQ